tara:strand:+ start:1467 stop:2330 length:864 start_codon:yes stop_codon:yes gene_type:complete
MQNDIETFIGLVYEKKQRKKVPKVVALDLDETIGSFSHLHILWNGIIKNQLNKDFTSKDTFFKIFDIYPEFLREHIFQILYYLYQKKINIKGTIIYLYTNNQCNTPWVQYIIDYLEYKLKIPNKLFDHTIGAFKIRNRIVEPNRTTHKKTYSDFINCAMLPKKTEICFIDNSYHNEMVHNKIYYIQPRSYYHNLSINTIISRFMNSSIGFNIKNNSILKDNFVSYIYDWFEFNNANRYIPKLYIPINSINITKKIIFHIKEFFYHKQKYNTKKSRKIMSNFTRKIIL